MASFLERFNFKSPVVYVGAIIAVIVVVIVSRKSGGSGSAQSSIDAQSANAANQLSLAQINADTERQRISAGVATLNATLGSQGTLASIGAQRDVAIAKIASDENVSLQDATYAYDLQNKSLENQRVLGLTVEDTKRVLGQGQLQNQLTAMDMQRYLTELSLNSKERMQLQEFNLRRDELLSQERIQDLVSLRGITYAQVQGSTQIGAIKAAKPSAWDSFLGNLGRGLGGGISSWIGGL